MLPLRSIVRLMLRRLAAPSRPAPGNHRL